MKIEIPEKVKVVMVITERIGIPAIGLFVFAYLYFSTLREAINILNEVRTDIKVNAEASKLDREELKREMRRLGYRRDR